MNTLEEKYDAAREKAVQALREHGMFSREFKRAFEESFALSEELKEQFPDSELLKIDFMVKMLKERRRTNTNRGE